MKRSDPHGMRSYWDDAARRNAAWYVDTSLSFGDPDMVRFFETGKVIVAEALADAALLPERRERALEIGSGLGRICLALADTFEEVVGVDVSPEMVERARELAAHPRVRFMVGDGTSLSGIDDASVDLVLSFTVFQHIPSTRVITAYLRDAGRVLRPGGVLVFQWNNERGRLRWWARRQGLGLLQRTGLRPERFGRHAPQFMGSRVPLDIVERALADGGLELAASRDEGSLYAWAWARRR